MSLEDAMSSFTRGRRSALHGDVPERTASRLDRASRNAFAATPKGPPSMTRMPLHEAMCRTLAAVLGHDRDTEETAADIIAGLNAAGYIFMPFEPEDLPPPPLEGEK